MNEAIEGGCLCNAVRYRVSGPVSDACFCHCRSCRRASGAPAVAWITVPRDAFAFTAAEPQRYRSSVHVVRTFCGRCGTALTYEHDRRAGAIDLTTASLDDPERFPPLDHVWASQALGWMLHDDDGLPRHERFRPNA